MAKEDRGFASMDRSKQREIASKGGKAAHQKGTAHEWTSEEAREAGRKGGMASHRRKQEQMNQGGSVPTGDQGSEPGGYNWSSATVRRARLVLGGRSTVGHRALDAIIGVRIPTSQPIPSQLRCSVIGRSVRLPASPGSRRD